MKATLIIFIIFLIVLGAFTLDSFIFHVVYLVAGAFLLGNWWVNHSFSKITVERRYTNRAFPGEIIPVQLTVRNLSRLPVPWIFLRDSLPLEASTMKVIQRAFSLPPNSNHMVDYHLFPRKRGFYNLGPLQITTGDILGLSPEISRESSASSLTVFPEVVAIKKISLPSRSPLGSLQHHHPILEDPSRSYGKRLYQPGDSLRRIDWKTSAASGELQVKCFEPSISLETVIFLDFTQDGYPQKFFYDASELAVVTAASLANLIVTEKQAVGLVTNGNDSTIDRSRFSIPSRKGQANLLLILETLARLQLSRNENLANLILQSRIGLPWGTTLIAITGHCSEAILNQLHLSRKEGKNAVLILVGEISGFSEFKSKAEKLKISCTWVREKQDIGTRGF